MYRLGGGELANGFEMLARFGYAARGFVYLVVAGLALFASFGGGSDNASSEGALTTLLGQPFGRFLLAAIAIGLFGFSLWRLAQAVFNADQREKNLVNAAKRGGKLISAVAYILMATLAAQLALGMGGGSGQGSEETIVSFLLGLPFGPFLVGLVGAGVMVAGGGQILKGVLGGFKRWLKLPKDKEKLLAPICMYGLAARGIVFLIVGGLLIYAGLTLDPDEAGSFPEALDWVSSLPFGAILYGAVSLGLLAFAVYCGILSLYRRVEAPSMSQIKQAVPGT